MIGVGKIIIGSVDKVGTVYTVALRMVDVATGKIEKTASEDCENCTINDVVLATVQNTARSMTGLSPVNKAYGKKLRI